MIENTGSRQNSFRRLRNILVNAAQLELGQVSSFSAGNPSPIHSLLPEHWQIYGNLLLLIALKCLKSSDQTGLRRKEVGIFSKRDVFHLTPEEVRSASADLYWQVRNFWQDKLSDSISQPTEMRRETINALQDLNDPEFVPLWKDPCTIGYAYQFLSSPARKKAQAEIQSSNKQLPLRKLINFTQIYTPDWVVDFLLVNCVVAQWKQAEQQRFPFLLKTPAEEIVLSRPAQELTVLDPACGSGHFLVRALDCLLGLYEYERIDRMDALRHIIANCIAGVDVDVFGLWVTAVALLVRCLRETVKADFHIGNLTHALSLQTNAAHDSLLGSLSRKWPEAHPLHKHFTAVVTNPPYIGRKLMSRELKAELLKEYPDCRYDLCAPFIARGLELLHPGGRLGLITQASLLYLPSYTKLRRRIIDKHSLVSAIEVGPGVFPLQGGEKVNSMLVVIQTPDTKGSHEITNGHGNNQAVFANIAQSANKVHALHATILDANSGTNNNCFQHSPSIFIKNERCAFTYSCPPEILELLGRMPKLSSIAEVCQGLATSDNGRFVRDWWQVDPTDLNKLWFPYVKGAGGNRWYSPIKHVINWRDNGADIKEAVQEAYPYLKGNVSWVVKNEQFYFRPGLCFSFVSSRDLAVRRLPAGCIFDVGASALFTGEDNEDFLLGYLNSSFINAVAKLLNPTVNFQVGDIKKLPVLPFSKQERNQLMNFANDCFDLKREIDQCLDTGLDCQTPDEIPLVFRGEDPIALFDRYCKRIESASVRLRQLEDSIDELALSNLERHIDTTHSITSHKIRTWIDSQTSRPQTVKGIETWRRSFADNLLRECVKKRLGTPGNGSSNCFTVPTDTACLRYEVLGLPGTGWWEQLLGVPLNTYLRELAAEPKLSPISPYFCSYSPTCGSFTCGALRDQYNRIDCMDF